MTDEPNTTDLTALSKVATQGEWKAERWGDGSSRAGCLNILCDAEEAVLAENVPRQDAVFTVALVNAYRSGDLVPASDVTAAHEAGRLVGLEEAAKEVVAADRANKSTPRDRGGQNGAKGKAVARLERALSALAIAMKETPDDQ